MRQNIMPQSGVIDGFYDPDSGEIRIQLDRPLKREGTTNCAFVMDASGSMDRHYRHPLFGRTSDVEKFIHQAAAFVAGYDSDKGVEVYLCCLGDGTEVKNLGNFPQSGLEQLRIDNPNLGDATYLLPALQQVVKEVVEDAGTDYGFIVLPTDGAIADLGTLVYGAEGQVTKSGIKGWAYDMAHMIENKQHAPVKIVLVGFDDASQRQMEELDNLDVNSSIDIFNALYVADLTGAMEALDSEAVNNEFTVAPAGYLEVDGASIVQFERGVPQRIDAKVPVALPSITVVLRDGNDEQRIPVQLPMRVPTP